MYGIKKVIGVVTQPGVIVLVLLGYGFLLLALSRSFKKKGLGWVVLGVISFYLVSTAPLPNYLVGKLESRYEPVTLSKNLQGIKYIVVLSGGLRLNDAAPSTSRLDDSSALRVSEGIRLFHLLGDSPTLLMTGCGPRGDMGSRMAAFARSLGVSPEKLISENQAKDTHGNAVEVRALVNNEPFLLVTSASHMLRAMGIFQRLGMKPIPAPGDFRYVNHYVMTDFFPSGTNLITMEALIHEYWGLAYLYLFPGRAGE